MKRYETYKDSGIEWIGEIPEHWEVKRLKYIGDSIIGITYNPKDVVQEGGTLVLRSSNIQNGKLSLKDNVYINKDIPEKLETKVGDILICSRNGSRRLIGKNITIDEKTEGETFGAFMTVFRTEKYEFISKYFNSQVFSGQSGLFLTSTINQLTVNTLNNFYTALPPKEERVLIAKYLDKKINEIDELISQKKKLLNLYIREKEAIINKAVTKGINPNVKFKETEITRLGDIPEHWKVIKLKYISNIINGYSPEQCKPSNTGEIEYIKVDNINRDKFKVKPSSNFTYKEFTVSDEPTILFPKRGAAIALNKVGIICKPFSFDTNLMGLNIMNEKINIKYLAYLIKNFSLISIADTSTIPQINNKHINPLQIPYPPKKEQQEIVNHIEIQNKRINDKSSTTKKLIDLLIEYKRVLISDVVTGKIKVT
ncbi:restriction endonuclease subunit S [Winogradskyella sp. PE311]|uniref:restriction endonuclease subunit S n=1 Tax=Winogradskyella sp. PE311 TaxID=3366943 RepID=UPI0039816C46